MKYQIPGQGEMEIKTIILDLNGTLSVGGEIVEGAKERTSKLIEMGFDVVLFTGNTRGDADDIAAELGIKWKQAKDGEDKKRLSLGLDADSCASIGNGLIDLEMMKVVRLSIVTLQAEGVHTKTLSESDLIVPTINDALDLFIDSNRLIASLRI